MDVMYLDLDTMTEKLGKFVRYVGPNRYKAEILTQDNAKIVVDIDDFWAV